MFVVNRIEFTYLPAFVAARRNSDGPAGTGGTVVATFAGGGAGAGAGAVAVGGGAGFTEAMTQIKRLFFVS